MKKTTKRILLLSCSLMAAGLLFTGIGFAAGGRPGISWTQKGIVSVSSQTEYRLEKTKINSFKNAQIDINSMADIRILPSDDKNYYIEYILDGDYNEPSYEVKGDTLYLSQDGSSISFINFGFDFSNMSNTKSYCNLYVPENIALGTLTVYNDAGNLSVSSISADTADITLDYGDLNIEDSSFKNLTVDMDAGDVVTKSVHAEVLSLINAFGDSTLKDFSGKEASVEIDSGDFYMEANTLDSFNGENDFGDMTLLLPEALKMYTFDLNTDFGSIHLPEDAPKGYYSEDEVMEEYYKTDGETNKTIQITVDTGDIEVKNL